LSVISAKWIIPFDKRAVAFFRLLCEESVFMPLVMRSILGMRVRFGYIFNQKFEDIMPTDRFYLGGENTLRGYGPDLAPPLGLYVHDEKTTLVPQGGKAMINANLELRFPIIQKLWGQIFHDVGFLVEDTLRAVTAESLLASTGFGFRYLTPLGPVRFDIGWKWRKYDKNESSFAWFLTLGNAF
jgi:outer membrane translocation and assembly module TamA